MPDPWYLAAVLAIVFGVTLALRAVPFAVLKPLRSSRFVATMATWLPAGILAILAVSTFLATAGEAGRHVVQAVVAVAVTAGVHLLAGRRTLLSVGAGTAAYIVLVAAL